MVATNIVIAVVTIVALIGALRVQGAIVSAGRIGIDTSRKSGHIVLGTALLLSWLLYRPSPSARWLATAVPAALLIHFVLLGTGLLADQRVVKAASRSGTRREFLHGPVNYVLAFTFLTAAFWRTSPVGMSALMVMIAGDGLGEVAGRAVRSPPIPWNKAKTLAGSAAVLVGGWMGATLAVGLFTFAGYVSGPWSASLAPLIGVAAAGAVAESLPLREIDNLTVPLASALAGYMLLGA